MAALASTPGEAAGAVLVLLWSTAGVHSAVSSLLWLKHRPDAATLWSTFRCCCSLRSAAVIFGIVVVLFGSFFGFAFTAQNLLQASEYQQFPPPGRLVTFNYQGNDITMHLWCREGTNSTGARPTMLGEHGGGSNSVSFDALAEVWLADGRRVCSYDRLGYGWTPSWIQKRTGGIIESGTILVHLLLAAGEQGPFVCSGHSAGAAACVSFALEATRLSRIQVVGVVGLDGYPDLIRAGCYRPGTKCQGSVPLDSVLPYVLFAGPTGISRPFLGGGDFYPPSRARVNQALYSRTRFWNVQYRDLASDVALPDALGYLFSSVPNGGFRDTEGLIHYNGSLLPSFVKVVWLPAWSTSNYTCQVLFNSNRYCCSDVGKGDSYFKDRFADSMLYWKQANLYAQTMSAHPGNKVIVAPNGTEHNFLNGAETYRWTASTILSEFP